MIQTWLVDKIDYLLEVLEREIFRQDCEKMNSIVIEIFDRNLTREIILSFLGKPVHRIPYQFLNTFDDGLLSQDRLESLK